MNKKFKKFSKKIGISTLALTLFFFNSLTASAQIKEDSIIGTDRYETAGLIADKQTYDTVILVNGDKNLSDGLSSSGLSGTINAPILLTKKNELPNATLNRLNNKNLNVVKKVYIIGGYNTIDSSVEKDIKRKNIEVERISGNSRIETSYNVAKKINGVSKVKEVMITNGFVGEADAMSIAPVAAKNKVPIILTDGKKIPFSTKELSVYAIGGSSAIDEKLIKETNATRVGGNDRFETNKKVIEKFYNGANGFYITKGYQLIDALTLSPLAKEKPIVLVADGSNKSILKGAKSITKVGGIDSNTYKQCLDIAEYSDMDITPNIIKHLTTIDGNEVSEMSIEMDNLGVIIEKTDTNKFEFDYVSVSNEKNCTFSVNKEESSNNVKNGKVVVSAKKKIEKNTDNTVEDMNGDNIINASKDKMVNILKIGIPDRVYSNFKIDTGNGSVRVYNIKGGATINVDNGTVNVEDSDITYPFNININNGVSSVSAESILSEIKFRANNGIVGVTATNINGNISVFGKDDTDIFSGVFKLKLKKEPSNLHLKLDNRGLNKLPEGWSNDYTLGNGHPIIEVKNSGINDISFQN
ncbi:cell wall-binding repeat-containing protein [Clostridioides sp. ZZV15-6388]|uniref:cell wall-binding repeat-containing protein n=1 Tax=unclassified Clostridioides TaxID=2635829 RepID=UPI001D0F8218|nr:cell wall-binding repeat-containing protein [Clostridioides sp. ZZV15-6388]MCC0664839.1 cell wall-binding repeat-containing protein [Clostridioides sp. ZZV15-6597]